MKTFMLALCCLTAVRASAGEVKLQVGGDAGLTGTATLVNKVQEDGSKYVLLTMKLKSSGSPDVDVIQESVYDKTGRPVRKIQTTSIGGEQAQNVVAVFDRSVVKVRISAGGKTKDQTFSIPIGTNTLASDEFWFVRDKVSPGDKTSYSRFDLTDLKWERIDALYKGTAPFTLDGKDVTANLVVTGGATAYVDEAGDPYFVKMGGVTLTRVKA